MIFISESVNLSGGTCRSGITRSFYKNEAQICPEIKNKLRTIEAWLQFILKNTLHHLIICGVSVHVFLQLETLSEKIGKSRF